MVNFSDFPAATPINGSGYYYSYYRNGCADNAWGSHLFRIEKDTAIKVAHIKGDGCGIKDGIFIEIAKLKLHVISRIYIWLFWV